MRVSPLILTSLVVTFVTLFLAGFVIGQKRRSRARQSFIVFFVSLSVVTFIDFCMRLLVDPDVLLVVAHVGAVIFMCTGILYLDLMYAMTERRIDTLYRVMAVLVAVGVVASLFPGMLSIGVSEELGFVIVMPSPRWAPFVAAGVLFPGIWAIIVCVRSYRTATDTQARKLAALLLRGMLLSVGIGALFVVLVPAFSPDSRYLYQFTPLTLLIHAFHTYVALTRYHLFSVDYDEIEQVSAAMFANVAEAVIVLDIGGRVVQTNDVARAMFGLRDGARDFGETIAGYNPGDVHDGWRTVLRNPEGDRDIVVSQTPMQRAGVEMGTLVLVRDVTEQMRFEADRARMEHRLRQAETLEAVGQLAGGVAHDFNNQLTGIVGYADLLRDEMAGNPEGLQLTEKIMTSAERSAGLASQLLAFARRGKYLTAPVDMHEIVAEVVSLLSHSIDKRITVREDLSAETAVTLGDPSQLQNAVLNLALNARDAMSEGGELTFASRLVDVEADQVGSIGVDVDPGSYVVVSVTDTGHGIEHDDLPHIYEPFFSTKEGTSGTGMGLAAVYGTITNHNGAIAVDTTPGEGSAFELYLPLHAHPVPSPAETPPADVEAPRSGGVLVVDDEAQVRDVTDALLSRLGYSVTTCADGHEALEIYRASWREIDVVLLDLVMPGLNGRRVFEQLRGINPQCVVLMCSGYSVAGEAQEILKAGGADFIQKPFSGRSLAAKIAELTQRGDRS